MVDLAIGLEEQEYYHGFIRREEAEYILRKTGDYLVRCEVERGVPSTVDLRLTGHTCKHILSVMVETEPKQKTVAEWILIREVVSEKWHVGEEDKLLFDSLPHLIEAYSNQDKKLELPPITVTKLVKSGMVPWVEQDDKPAPPPSTTIEKARLKKCVKKPKWELNPADVILSTEPDNLLGSGNYGYVQRGHLNQNGTKIAVAIKVVGEKDAKKKAKSPTNAMKKKEPSKKSQYTLMSDTLKEAAAMRDLCHPNVVKMYGVVVDRSPIMMVIELVNKGSLKGLLEDHKMNEAEMHNLSVQAAWGMEYLHSKLVIHRDIAARNCLIQEIEKVYILKISDFGLSKLGKNYHLSKTIAKLGLPVKTLAPESCLNYAFNSATDVWSFGFLMYEIYTHGKQPLPDWNWARLVEYYNTKDKNDCPQELPGDESISELGRNLMRGCWKYTPADRLTMSDIACILERATGLKPPQDVPLRKQNEEKKKMIESMLPRSPATAVPKCPTVEERTKVETPTRLSKEALTKEEPTKEGKEQGTKRGLKGKQMKESATLKRNKADKAMAKTDKESRSRGIGNRLLKEAGSNAAKKSLHKEATSNAAKKSLHKAPKSGKKAPCSKEDSKGSRETTTDGQREKKRPAKSPRKMSRDLPSIEA